jgi:hypothetical protein
MVEKILKETYVTPKVELTQNDYNRLVQMATMKAKKIEESAREVFVKEGVVKIEFDGRFVTKRDGVPDMEHYKFDVSCKSYQVRPFDNDYDKPLFSIPQEMRERIATKVKRYVEEVFVANFSEHVLKLNAIGKLEEKTERERRQFIVWTVTGWLLAVLMFAVVMFK